MGVDLCDPKGMQKKTPKKTTTFSAVSISERTQLSGPQLYEFHS